MTALPPDTDTLVAIDDIIENIADHMTHLADTLASAEMALSEHFGEVLNLQSQAFMDVQNLDYLHQSITDTAKLLSLIGSGCRSKTQIRGLLKLESTRALLGGPLPDHNIEDSGVCDFF